MGEPVTLVMTRRMLHGIKQRAERRVAAAPDETEAVSRMPEYMSPGVYVEETSFRSRSIEGVPTSTFGMTGLTAYGPVPYILTDPPVVMGPMPTLVTSFTEFERAFGGLDAVGVLEDTTNYLGYAARAFFDNGGQRLYVARVFPFAMTAGNAPTIDLTKNFATLPLGQNGAGPIWRARWPGHAGNKIKVTVGFRRSENVLIGGVLTGVGPGAASRSVPTRRTRRRTMCRR
jgi:uncharacterized protein